MLLDANPPLLIISILVKANTYTGPPPPPPPQYQCQLCQVYPHHCVPLLISVQTFQPASCNNKNQPKKKQKCGSNSLIKPRNIRWPVPFHKLFQGIQRLLPRVERKLEQDFVCVLLSELLDRVKRTGPRRDMKIKTVSSCVCF